MEKKSFNLKKLLREYPVISWCIVGGVILMLIASSVGLGFIGPKEDRPKMPDQATDMDQAQREVERWIYEVEKEPSDFNYRQLSRAYKGANKLDKALEAGLKASELDPNDVLNHQCLFEVYSMLNDKEEAMTELKKIIALKPDDIEARFKLAAYIHLYGKNSKDAIPEYEKILQLDPGNEQTHLLLGLAYMDQEIYPKAKEQFEWILKRQPDNLGALEGLGEVYMKTKEYDKAILQYNKAIELKPEMPYLYSQVAKVYVEKGDNDKALKNYNKALELDKENLEAIMSLAEFYEKQGKKDDSVKQLEAAKLVAGKKSDIDSLLNIAKLYEKLGKKDEASLQLEEIHEMAKKNKDVNSLIKLSILYEKQGDKNNAIKELQIVKKIAEDQKQDELKKQITKEIERLSKS